MNGTTILTGNEQHFPDDELIVSKTNLKGHITYANKLFIDISGYNESQVIGKPHSIIRHPDMPRVIFKLLWDTVSSGKEIFAYVINRCENGDHYWVYAHVTPSENERGEIIGYHSNRRTPKRSVLDGVIIPLYRQLKAAEDKISNRKEGLVASEGIISNLLAEQGVQYDQYIMEL